MSWVRPLVGCCALVAGGLIAGCDTDDGRTLRPPPPGATAPPLASSTTATTAAVIGTPPVGSASGTGAPVEGFALTSPAFGEGGVVPDRYTCPTNVSPPLAWAGVPPGTVELAVVVRDPDALDGEFVHWVVSGIDPASTALPEGAVPAGAVEARNDISEFGWFGPCPPEGEVHRYVFTLHSLSVPSGVAFDAGAPAAIAAIEAASAATATLTATYP